MKDKETSDSKRIPPQNLEAEKSVLGATLIDKDAIIKIADTLNAQDFYDERNGHIFEAMKKLYEKHSPIDVLTLSELLAMMAGWTLLEAQLI